MGLKHIMNGQTEFMGMIRAGREERWRISRSYGDLAILNILCPQDLDFSQIIEDTIVITEPERDHFQASAQALTVYITDPYEEYGDMPAEELLEDAEDEPAEDLRGES